MSKVSVKLNEKIESELMPFLDSIRKMNKESTDFIKFKRVLTDFLPKYERAWKTFDFVTKDLDQTTDIGRSSSSERL